MIQKYLVGSLSIEALTIPITGLASSLQGLKIVQLSDFHFDGVRLSDQLLEQAIAETNRLKPDAIVLTGDYITDDPEPIHELAKRLQKLESRAGIYAVLGNHDLQGKGARKKVTKALTAIGIQVLWNEVAYPFGKDLALVGLPDYWSKHFNPAAIMPKIAPNVPRIVLSHNPDSATDLQAWRVDLQLSGHTHGGQIIIPGMGPLIKKIKELRTKLPLRAKRFMPFLWEEFYEVVQHWEWSHGLHQVGNNLLYINRGLGTYSPGRFFCPPELTLITVTTQVKKN